MASVKEIVAALHKHYDARDKAKAVRADLVRIAVECGMAQEDAIRGNLVDWLDGYLAGAGVLPASREPK